MTSWSGLGSGDTEHGLPLKHAEASMLPDS